MLALSKAMEARNKANIPFTDSFSIYDLAERHGVNEISFVEIPGLEEIYLKDHKRILIGSLRPSGRQAFSCGHGFGHHVFGHGMCFTSVDDPMVKLSDFQPNEFLADCFSDYLLMPKTTVCYGFACRQWDIKQASPLQIYTIACWLGVGYSTLIQHMRDNLRLISSLRAAQLLNTKPKQIKSSLIGEVTTRNVVVVDECWSGRPVDISAGDFIYVSENMSADGECIGFYKETFVGSIFVGRSPGCDGKIFVEKTQKEIPVRVSRPNYVGRNIFRFEEDPDFNEKEITSH